MDAPPSRKYAKAPENVAAQRFPALIISSHAGGHWFESSSLHQTAPDFLRNQVLFSFMPYRRRRISSRCVHHAKRMHAGALRRRKMLAEMPFDRITVSALVKRAEGSPNTFYYHYQDIYALLDDWFQKQVNALVPAGEPIEWKPVTKNILRECRAHSKTIYHVFDSLSRDRLDTLFENFLRSAVQDAE